MGVAGAEDLREHGFGEDRRHAEEGGKPHPEDGARAAHGDRGGDAGKVAGAHLSGNRRGERLEGRHAVLAGLGAEDRESAEDLAEGVAEAADLDEAQLDGEINARTHKERYQAVHAPEQTIDALDKGSQVVHLHLKENSSETRALPMKKSERLR